MLNRIKTLIAVAVLSGTVGANVQAATLTAQKGNSILDALRKKHTSALNPLTNKPVHHEKAETISSTKKYYSVIVKGLAAPAAALSNLAVVKPKKAPAASVLSRVPAKVVAVPKTPAAATTPVRNWASASLKEAMVLTPATVVAKTPAGQAPTPAKPQSTSAAPAATVVPTTSILSQVTVNADAAPASLAQAAAPQTPEESAAGTVQTPVPIESSSVPEKDDETQPTPTTSEAAPDADDTSNQDGQAPDPASEKETEPEETTKEITVKATAYTASCEGCSGITATGVNIKDNPDKKVIAVDPDVIPLGSKVYVEGFGEATAADTGGAIKGNRIDVFIPSEKDANEFGVKHLKVRILN